MADRALDCVSLADRAGGVGGGARRSRGGTRTTPTSRALSDLPSFGGTPCDRVFRRRCLVCERIPRSTHLLALQYLSQNVLVHWRGVSSLRFSVDLAQSDGRRCCRAAGALCRGRRDHACAVGLVVRRHRLRTPCDPRSRRRRHDVRRAMLPARHFHPHAARAFCGAHHPFNRDGFRANRNVAAPGNGDDARGSRCGISGRVRVGAAADACRCDFSCPAAGNGFSPPRSARDYC